MRILNRALKRDLTLSRN